MPTSSVGPSCAAIWAMPCPSAARQKGFKGTENFWFRMMELLCAFLTDAHQVLEVLGEGPKLESTAFTAPLREPGPPNLVSSEPGAGQLKKCPAKTVLRSMRQRRELRSWRCNGHSSCTARCTS